MRSSLRILLVLFVALSAFAAWGCQPAQSTRQAVESVWLPVATPSRASLRGLAVVNASVLWVGGAGGTLLRTVDGGRTWQDVAPRDSTVCDFRDLHAFDADTALAMVAGQPARVYRTSDGGANWRIVHEDARPAAFFDAMAFAGDRGALFGDAIDGAFVVLESDDRGESWSALARERVPSPLPGEAGFAASGTCVAFDPVSGAVVLATGGGPSRCLAFAGNEALPRIAELPMQQGNASRGAFSIAFADAFAGDLRAVIVGGDYQAPEVGEGTAACSDDGGRTWQAAAGGAGGYRSAVVWVERDRVMAVGSHGASVSEDGGHTWRSFGNVGFHSIAKGRDGSVWACGSEGRVARLVSRR